MRVLWLTNNACSALELLDPKNTRGGWLVSLEKELSCHDGIELHVGFFHRNSLAPFQHGPTTFHSMGYNGGKSKITRYLRRFFADDLNDRKDIEKILNLVKKVQPHLIHIHGTEGNFGLIQEHTNIPIVISIQGLLNPYAEKFYSGIPQLIARRHESYRDKLTFRSAKRNFRLLNAKAERERRILNHVKYVIGRTSWDRAITRLLAPKSTYFSGQEMLRPSFYKKTWHNTFWEGKIKIVSITSDALFKGFESIVRTAMLLHDYQGFDFVWYVAGVDRNSYCVRVVTEWLSVELERIGIRLLGNQDERQLVDLLTTSDIFCQVSHIENSPNSLCEAMMVGMPCIATFAGGTSSILSDKKEGILVQDGDPYVLSGEIMQLYENFEKAKLFGAQARIRATSRHNKSQIINELLDVYSILVSKS